MLPLKIIATGVCMPELVYPSEFFDNKLNLKPGTVARRSGIASRRFFRDSDIQSEVSAKAINHALVRANMPASALDLVISASAIQEQALPCTAAKILDHLAVKPGTPGFDVNTSCLSFVTALHIAANFLATGAYQRIAIVATDFASRGIDWHDLACSAIFGDGSAAVIVERGEGVTGCLSYQLQTYPKGKEYCTIKAGGTLRNPNTGMSNEDFYFHMNGKSMFRLASSVVDGFLAKLFEPLGFGLESIDLVVPHQASHLGLKHIVKKLGLAPERVIDIYATHGNQVAASLPTALHHAHSQQLLTPGTTILLIGTGAGLCWGAMILTV